jgi:prepilin-type processing-associated H-X9-DG protein
VIIDATDVKVDSTGWVSCRGQVSLRDIPDGTSNTFMLGEKHITADVIGKVGDDGDGCVYDNTWPRYGVRLAGTQNGTDVGYYLHDQYDNCKGSHTPCYRTFGSWHPGRCQFAFADSHVRSVSNSTAIKTLEYLATRDDGQIIPPYD